MTSYFLTHPTRSTINVDISEPTQPNPTQSMGGPDPCPCLVHILSRVGREGDLIPPSEYLGGGGWCPIPAHALPPRCHIKERCRYKVLRHNRIFEAFFYYRILVIKTPKIQSYRLQTRTEREPECSQSSGYISDDHWTQ